jgi:hypothetical protein
MANAFDQFDAPAQGGNAFDQFDAKSKKKESSASASGYLHDALMGPYEGLAAISQMLTRGAERVTEGTGVGDRISAYRKEADEELRNRKANYDLSKPEDRTGSGVVRGLAQSTLVAPAMVAGGSGILANAGLGAGAGALGGVLEPVYEDRGDFWSQKGKQAGMGAAGGAVVGGAVGGVAKAIAPKIGADQAQLVAEKVSMTPGQAMGGIAKTIEDKMTSWPIIGDLIQNRRFQGITDFNRAIYSRATAPFGDEGAQVAAKADVGRKGVAAVGDYLSSKYEAALSKSAPAPYDDAINAALDKLSGMVPSARQQDFQAVIKREIYDKFTPGNTITPSVAKQADSELGRLASEYRGSSVADDRIYAGALREAQSQIRQLFARSNPDTAPMIRAADEGWATLVQMENAAALVGARDGIFTPAQFLSAGVKKSDKSRGDRKFARGEVRNQDIAEAAKDVLPSTVPDSGTVGRGLMAGGAGYGLAGGGAFFEPTTAFLTALLASPYLPGVGPAMSRAAFARPAGAKTLRELAEQSVPYLSAGAGAYATGR